MEIDQIGQTIALNHWKKYRPKMVRHLRRKGVLQLALDHAAKMATEFVVATPPSVMPRWETREQALKRWILLPAESEVPILPVDQMPFSQPGSTTESPVRPAT